MIRRLILTLAFASILGGCDFVLDLEAVPRPIPDAGPAGPVVKFDGASGTDGRFGAPMTVRPTLLEGTILSCEVKPGTPALPEGLTLDPATCTISGSPKVAIPRTTYTLVVTSSTGTAEASVTLEIDAIAPTVSFAGSGGTHGSFGVEMALTPTSVLANGAPITNCTLKAGSPPLPAGLTINPTTCAITGTPQGVGSGTWTVVATNSAGTIQADVWLEVVALKPSLSYTANPGRHGVPIEVTTTLSANGSNIQSCGIKSGTTPLPPGLSIDSTTCAISGTPTAVGTTACKIVATNDVGSTEASVTFVVSASPPSLSYAPSQLVFGVAGTIDPTTLATNGGAIQSCAVKAGTTALPDGLTVNSTSCAVSGTTRIVGSGEYTLVVTNAGGTTEATLVLSVVAAPPSVGYSAARIPFGEAARVDGTIVETGAVTSCAVKAGTALPEGLSVEAATCDVVGTPTATANESFTIVASSDGGTTEATLQLEVYPLPPVIAYPTTNAFDYGATVSIQPTVTLRGASITGCAIKQGTTALPADLTLDASTCAIGGTARVSGTDSYTLVADSAGGAAEATVTIALSAIAPTFAYDASGATFVFGVAHSVAPITLEPNGGSIQSCVIKTDTAALPDGLSLDSKSCVVSGTTRAVGTGSYSIVATNAGGSSEATLKLTVVAAPPSVSYAAARIPFGEAARLAATVAETGASTTCALETGSSLPAGLSVESGTCDIVGTPTETANGTFTIVATNDGGTSEATLQLEVYALPPLIAFPTTNVFDYGSTVSLAPTVTARGAAITSCAIKDGTAALPADLTLDAGCVIGGTPRVAATGSYTIVAASAAGATEATVALELRALAPVLAYPSNASGKFGVDLTVSPAELLANGEAVQCALKTGAPALPAGLTLSPDSCVVSGRPTELVSGGSYVIVASNSGGATEATLGLTISASAPSLGYVAATRSYGSSDPVSPAAFSTNGADLLRCELAAQSPALPAGLAVNNATCAVEGTPQPEVAGAGVYTIVAENAAGTVEASLELTITAIAPSLAYQDAAGTCGTTLEIRPMALSANGAATACSLEPANSLPGGLVLDAGTCAIAGIPTEAVQRTLTVVATNSAGSTRAFVKVTIAAAVPELSFAGASGTTGLFGTPMSVTPALVENGAAVTTCTVAPQLPQGLSINPVTCVISGIPEVALAPTDFLVTAHNLVGDSLPASVNLSVAAGLPRLQYAASPLTATYGTAITAVSPLFISDGGSPITACAATPALPAGLALDPVGCVLSGTPTAAAPQTTYSVVATSSVGDSLPATLTLTVQALPPTLSYSAPAPAFFGTPYSLAPAALLANGSPVTGCRFKDAAPPGLTVGATDCVVAGTPTGLVDNVTYTLIATNAAGDSADVGIVLTIKPSVPTLRYPAATTTWTYKVPQTLAPEELLKNGADITDCVASTPLPSGLTLNRTTCAIAGSPNVTAAEATYSIVAKNSAGPSAPALVKLAVIAAPPIVSYDGASGTTGTYGQPMTVIPIVVSNGSTVTACGIKANTPALPVGLSVGATTCVISGIPREAVAAQTYTVVATNGAGSSPDAAVTLSVLARPPTLAYPAGAHSGRVGETLSIAATLEANGDSIVSCSSAPALPLGLEFTADCSLTGAPATAFSGNLSVTATNSGGASAPTSVNLTILPSAPTLAYDPALSVIRLAQTLHLWPTSVELGGAPSLTGCALSATSPRLPSGLTVNELTCEISGAPTVASPATSYGVVATNAGGTSAEASFLLQVDGPPTLSYVGAAGTTGTYGVPMSVLPTVLEKNGLEITGCALDTNSAPLPSGLSVNATTCAISGTPLEAVEARTCSVRPTNAAGSPGAVAVTLTVKPAAPALSYASVPTARFGTFFQAHPTIVENGDPVDACALGSGSPPLPAGLQLTANCSIEGIPQQSLAPTTFYVIATNAGGTSPEAAVMIQIDPAEPLLAYAAGSGVAGQAMAVAPTQLESRGAPISDCSVASGVLPAGLSLNPVTCVIAGTPSDAVTVSLAIQAVNAAGPSAPANVTLAIAAGQPTISYSGAANTSGVVGVAMSVAPTLLEDNGALITACGIDPPLPAGLSLGVDCVISGIPLVEIPTTIFTVTAVNAVNVGSATVALSVVAAPSVPTISFAGVVNAIGTVGVPMVVQPTTLESNGDAISDCTSDQALPAGLSLDPLTCRISGTPTVYTAPVTRLITAHNGIGPSLAAPVTLGVIDVPQVSYASYSGPVGATVFIDATVVERGSALVGCAIKAGTAQLPSTLAIDPISCDISGVPTEPLAQKLFTIVARNAAGASLDATVSIEILAAPPTLQYPTGSFAFVVGSTRSLAPSLLGANGATVTACTVTPQPGWLSIDGGCVLRGAPGAVVAEATYTVMASNAAGTTPVTLALRADADVPVLGYDGAVGTVGIFGLPMLVRPTALVANGAAVTSCRLADPSIPLPGGVTLNNACEITGTPTATLAPTGYGIIATNGVGDSQTAWVALRVDPARPSLSFAGVSGTLVAGASGVLAPSTFAENGATVSCSVSPALPDGLTLDVGSCRIGGTPWAYSPATSYRIDAANMAGVTTAFIEIVVIDRPALAYAEGIVYATLGVELAVAPARFEAQGSEATCQIEPALPAGLALSPSTCRITGTPTEPRPLTTYTLTATNAAGPSDAAPLALVVRRPALLAISDGPDYDFGSQAIGGFADHLFVVMNDGDLPASTIAALDVIGDGYSFRNGPFPGFGGSCSDTLEAASYCLIAVRFQPTLEASDIPGLLSLNYFDGLQTVQATRGMRGTGTSGAALEITAYPPAYYQQYGLSPDAPTFDFGSQAIGSSAEHTFFATSTGGTSATFTGAVTGGAFGFAGGAFPGTGGTCTGVLDPGETCTLVVVFNPADPNVRNGLLALSDGANTLAARPLVGSGSATAIIGVYDHFDGGGGGINIGAQWEFGVVGVGQSSTHDFYVVNSGGADASELTGMALPAGFSFPGGFPGGPPGGRGDRDGLVFCPSTLPAQSACVVRVEFLPTAPVVYGAELVIGHDGIAAQASRALRGSGTELALLSIQDLKDGPLYSDFGTVGVDRSSPRALLLTNAGARAATELTAASLEPPFGFTDNGVFPGGTGTFYEDGRSFPFCGSTLEPGGECVFGVAFSPKGDGVSTANVELAYHDGANTRIVTRGLTGTGTSLAVIRAVCDGCDGPPGMPPSLRFGKVGVGTPQTKALIFQNEGARSAQISVDPLPGPFGIDGGTSTVWKDNQGYPRCPAMPFELPVGEACGIVLVFQSETAGSYRSTLTLHAMDSTTPTLEFQLEAEATLDALISIRTCPGCGDGGGTPRFDFGAVAPEAAPKGWLFVTNDGASEAVLADVLFSGDPRFQWIGGMAPGADGQSQLPWGPNQSFPFCGSLLEPGTTCALGIQFVAGTELYTYLGSLTLVLEGMDPVVMDLQGTVTSQAIVSIRECYDCGSNGGDQLPTYSFGAVPQSQSREHLFFLRNEGISAAMLSPVEGPAGNFAYGGTLYPGGEGIATSFSDGTEVPYCGTTLEPFKTCAVRIVYSAFGQGWQESAFVISLGEATRASVGYRLTGEVATGAVVTMSTCESCGPGGEHYFGFVAVNQQRDVHLFLRNEGPMSATVGFGGFGQGGPFVYYGGYAGEEVNLNGRSYPYCADGELLANSTCVVRVTFMPMAAGSFDSPMTMNVANGNVPVLSMMLHGTGTNQAIVSMVDCPSCEPSGQQTPMRDFGFVRRSSSVEQIFFLRNRGNADADIAPTQAMVGPQPAFTWGGMGNFPGRAVGEPSIQRDGTSYPFCGTKVLANQTCVLRIVFNATGSGREMGSVSLQLLNATVPMVKYDLAGEPTELAIVTVSTCIGCGGTWWGSGRPQHDFGLVAANTSVDQYFLLRNDGANAASLSPGLIEGTTGAYSFYGGSYPGGFDPVTLPPQNLTYPFCGSSLEPDQVCVVRIQFIAVGEGTQIGGFTIPLTNATTSAVGYDLKGTPTNDALLSIRSCPECGIPPAGGTSSESFGEWPAGSTAERLLIVANRGNTAATFRIANIIPATSGDTSFGFGPSGFPGGTGTVNWWGVNWWFCPNVNGASFLEPGSECVVKVAFTAMGDGERRATLQISADGPAMQTVKCELSGTSTTAAVVALTDCETCSPPVGPEGWVPLHSFGDLLPDEVRLQYFYLRNLSPTSAKINDVSLPAGSGFRFIDGSEFPGGLSGTVPVGQPYPFCPRMGSMLSPNSTCVIGVEAVGGGSALSARFEIFLQQASRPSVAYDLWAGYAGP